MIDDAQLPRVSIFVKQIEMPYLLSMQGLNGLRRMHGYVYGGVSLVVGVVGMVVVMGSLGWSRGFAGTVCET